jgi:hypothetical protein
MNDWNENNFLERLMPLMRQKDRVRQNDCPDVESLCAFAEDRARGMVRNAIAAHVAECSRCAELHARLVNFATPAAPEDEGEWRNTEKRLQNWMEGFLHSQQGPRQAGPETQRDPAAPGAESLWNWLSSWKAQWAVGAVTAMALVAVAMLLIKLNPREVQTAQKSHPSLPTHAQTALSPTLPESLGQPRQSPTNSYSADRTKSQARTGDRNNRRLTYNKSPHEPANTGVAAAGQASSPQTSSTPFVATQGNPSSAPAGASHSTVTSNGTPTVAELRPPPPPRTGAVTSHSASLTHSFGGYVGAPAATGKAVSRPTANRPASFRLDTGTRVFVQLSSVTRQKDGSLRFHGTLVLPVAQAGAFSLDRGTAVSGFEKESQGQTSLVITELVVSGTRYTLKGDSGTRNALKTGGGKAVQFDAGQVIEMFVESASVYEMSPDATGQQGPAR